MPWAQRQITELRRVLADLYPREADQRRVVADAQLPAATILFDASAANSWSSILREANLRDRVDAVLKVALDDYPDNEVLRRVNAASAPGSG
jgi:hypothetical protein